MFRPQGSPTQTGAKFLHTVKLQKGDVEMRRRITTVVALGPLAAIVFFMASEASAARTPKLLSTVKAALEADKLKFTPIEGQTAFRMSFQMPAGS